MQNPWMWRANCLMCISTSTSTYLSILSFYPIYLSIYLSISVYCHLFLYRLCLSIIHLSISIINLCHPFFFFLRQSFALVPQTGVQWHNLCSRQPLPPGSKRFSCLSLQSSYDYRHVPICRANFVFLVKVGFLHVGQSGLKLLTSGDLPALASQSAEIRGMSHCAWPISFLFFFSFFFFFFWWGETESCSCHPGWSAMAQSRLTATSTFWVQAILLPQPPK
uniref:Uncharacterized protein n=1 Tax=Macaca fascicularis TaxID=9541 RepID=A0A7N9DBL3_MACFA